MPNRLFTFSLLFFLLVLSSCKSDPRQAVASAPPSPSTSSLDMEAKAEAEKFWQARLMQCGENWSGLGPLLDGVSTLIQVKEPQLQLKADKLTEADKLNGFAWRGNARMAFQTFRVFLQPKWSSWRNFGDSGTPSRHFTIGLAKKNGAWVIEDRPFTLQPIPCDKIPPG